MNLSTLCYNIKYAENLLSNVSKDGLETIGGFDGIKRIHDIWGINPSETSNDYLDLKCVLLFTSAGRGSGNNTVLNSPDEFKSNKKLMESYKEWLKKSGVKNHCNCSDVKGIGEYYKERYSLQCNKCNSSYLKFFICNSFTA